MLPSRKVNQIMMASCCAPCVETCGSNIPQIRANDVLFPLLLVFSVRSSLSDDTVTDFVVDVLRWCSRYLFSGLVLSKIRVRQHKMHDGMKDEDPEKLFIA